MSNDLNEITPVADTSAPILNKRVLMIGGGAVALLGAVAAIAASNREVQWADAPEPVLAAAPAAPQLALATPAAPAAQDPTSIIRGVIQSQSEAVIASRMTAKITAMPYRAGQKFGRGALLASFDCSILRAELNAANAATAAYRKTHETNVELDAYKAVGRNEVGVSAANLGKAQAEAQAINAQTSDCAVYAPFSGTVVEQIAHQHDVAAAGQPLLKIQDGTNLEVQVIVPSNWLTWVRPGATFAFKIDETGATVKGTVSRLGASVDPVSKTIRVIGTLDAEGAMVLPGMSGSAQFDKPGVVAGNGKPAGA